MRGQIVPICPHCERKHKGECWRLTGACLVCGSNEHKVIDCPRERFFTVPQAGGTVSIVKKDNKSVASLSFQRLVTQTVSR